MRPSEREPMTNRLTIDTISTTPIGQLIHTPVDQLAMLADDIAELEEKAKTAKRHLNMLVRAKFADELGTHVLGTKRIPVDGIDVVVNLPKNVAWDQDALRAIEERTDQWGKPLWAYMEIKRSVAEKVYETADESAKGLLQSARTVKAGAQSVKFERKGAN
jgi:hypothetical protein